MNITNTVTKMLAINILRLAWREYNPRDFRRIRPLKTKKTSRPTKNMSIAPTLLTGLVEIDKLNNSKKLPIHASRVSLETF